MISRLCLSGDEDDINTSSLSVGPIRRHFSILPYLRLPIVVATIFLFSSLLVGDTDRFLDFLVSVIQKTRKVFKSFEAFGRDNQTSFF